MKKALLFLSALALLGACKSGPEESITTDLIRDPADSANAPIMEFKEERIDFGTIQEGEKVTRVFEFTNAGKSDLVIADVSATCGCTVPNKWPKEPIAPGASGKFEVTFNSQGKPGQQVKQIMVTANTIPSITTVALAGNVNRKGEM